MTFQCIACSNFILGEAGPMREFGSCPHYPQGQTSALFSREVCQGNSEILFQPAPAEIMDEMRKVWAERKRE